MSHSCPSVCLPVCLVTIFYWSECLFIFLTIFCNLLTVRFPTMIVYFWLLVFPAFPCHCLKLLLFACHLGLVSSLLFLLCLYKPLGLSVCLSVCLCNIVYLPLSVCNLLCVPRRHIRRTSRQKYCRTHWWKTRKRRTNDDDDDMNVPSLQLVKGGSRNPVLLLETLGCVTFDACGFYISPPLFSLHVSQT